MGLRPPSLRDLFWDQISYPIPLIKQGSKKPNKRWANSKEAQLEMSTLQMQRPMLPCWIREPHLDFCHCCCCAMYAVHSQIQTYADHQGIKSPAGHSLADCTITSKERCLWIQFIASLPPWEEFTQEVFCSSVSNSLGVSRGYGIHVWGP